MANEEAAHQSGNDLNESGTFAQHEKRSSIRRDSRSDENLSDIWNLCFGWQERGEPKEQNKIALEIFRGIDGLEMSLESLPKSSRVVFIELPTQRFPKGNRGTSIIRRLNFVSLELESCYHSSMVRSDNDPRLEICYNIRENLAFDVVNMQAQGIEKITLIKNQQSIYSSFSFHAKRLTLVVTNATDATERSMREFVDLCEWFGQAIHPFTLHLSMMFEFIYAKGDQMEDNLMALLSIEKQILNGNLISMKLIEELGNYSQRLHILSRNMIILEHYNDRDLSNVRNLLRDIDRLEKESKKLGKEYAVDPVGHDQTRDGFLCLQDFCIDRDRRLKDRKQRVQNLIALLYNLTANRDSITSLKIAEESTKIAHETKRDSNSMTTIATLTMFYLPATFVCSFFGTNFFALDTNGPGRASFVVSKLWWVYVVTTVPLTLLTFGVWVWWTKWSGERKRNALL